MCRKKAARGCVTTADMGNMGKVFLPTMSDIDAFLLTQGLRYTQHTEVSVVGSILECSLGTRKSLP